MKRFKASTFIISLILISSLVITGCSQSNQEVVRTKNTNDAEKIPVEVLEVKQKDFTSKLPVTGSIEGKKEVNIFAEISGKLMKLKVDEGDRVKEGETIAVLKRDRLEANLKQAKANLKVVKSEWEKIQAGARKQEIKQAEANLDQAQANYENAKADYERIKNLYYKGAATEQRLDNTKTKYQAAEANLQIAKENLDLIREGARQEDRAIVKSKVEQAKANFKLAETQLEDTIITAPTSGVITDIFLEEGEMASPSQPLAYLIKMNEMLLKADVSSKDLSKLSTGQRVEVTVTSYPDEIFLGRVSKIGDKINETSRTVKVEVKIDNSDSNLKSGMFAQGNIIIDRFKEAVFLPEEAVQSEQKNFVYLAQDNQVIKREVAAEELSKDRYLIRSGLKSGEEVIISNFAELTPGDQVYVSKQGSEQ